MTRTRAVRLANAIGIIAASMGLYTAGQDIADGSYWRGICLAVAFVAALIALFTFRDGRKKRRKGKWL